MFIENNYKDAAPGIEEIQDLVEKVLIETGHAKTAKAYILYRDRRSRIREQMEVRKDSRQPRQFHRHVAPGGRRPAR